jgi:uncharacterized protein YgiM (DUF1202 family)
VIARAQQGDKLPVTGRNADSIWLEATLPDGRSGWILAAAVQLNVAADMLPLAKIPTTSPAPTAKP